MPEKPDAPSEPLQETGVLSGARPGTPTPPSAPTSASVPSLRAASRALLDGEVVAGRYRVVRFIARGGMGEVYEVHDTELAENVALKTIRAEIAGDEAALQRFKRELQLSRKLSHPNVCRLFDLGRHRTAAGDVTFLTMELLAGETLRDRVKRAGRLGLEEARPIACQIAAALAVAQEAGIVHRDFKSANVLLTRGRSGERAVVTDFGLARAAAGTGLEASVTATGDIVGTPAYMSPEQAEGRPVGPAADVYALGVVLYEMVTGRWPFAGDTAISMVLKRLTEAPPSPRLHVPDLDPRWEAVIMRCLERRPEDRFASAAEIIPVLEGKVAPPARPWPRVPSLPGRRAWLLGGAGVLLVLAVVLGPLFLRAPAPPPPPAASTPAPAPAARARRSVAVLGFKDLAGRPETAWLSTAVSEMLRTELGAGSELRTVPGETVARMKLELSLADADSLARDTLARIRSNLGADFVVVGSYLAQGGKLRLDLRVQETASPTDEVFAAASETGGEEELFDLVSRAGTSLRQALGMGAVPEADAVGVRASLPAGTQATRLYAEGLARLRVFDALAARGLLERAAAADASHALAHSALASAHSALGHDEKARAAAQRALDLAQDLSREDRLTVEAQLREASAQWDEAVRLHQALFGFFPDNLEYGLRLAAAQTSAGRGKEALATVAELRKLSASVADDPRIDLAEAAAAKALTDYERMGRAAGAAARKAETRSARLLLAQARLAECTALVNGGNLDDGVVRCGEAIGIFSGAGDTAGVARCQNVIGVASAMKGDMAGARRRFEEALLSSRRIGDQKGIALQLGNVASTQDELGDPTAALRTYEEALGVSRRAGFREGVARTLANIGMLLDRRGQPDAARRRYEQALEEWKAIGATEGVATVRFNLGEIAQRQGRLDEALRQYEAALAAYREHAREALVAETGGRLAEVQLERGSLAEAEALARDSAADYERLADREAQAGALRLLARVLQRKGDLAGAKRAEETAAALPASPAPR